MVKIKLVLGFLCFISLNCLAQVGINTDTPSATLDVNGNVKVRNISTVTGAGANLSDLVIDKATKEIKMLQSSSGNTFAMNYITYHLNNTDKDYVKNFDTRIPTSDYTLVIVGNHFTKSLKMASGLSYPGVFSPANVYSFGEGGTWRISADYHDGGTQDEQNGDWAVYCLVINRTMLIRLSDITTNMNGSQTGSAGSYPAGL